MQAIVTALWLLLPAYVANSAPVVAGGGSPVDGRRTWRGKRVLGDGKTWRGTAAGVTAGAGVAALLAALQPLHAATAIIPPLPAAAILTVPLGALLGDMAASFCKRQLGIARGKPLPGVDQLDFVVGALVLTKLAAPIWTLATIEFPVLVAMLAVTPVLHLTANRVAFRAGWKADPW